MHSLSPPVEQLPPSPVPLRVQCTHRVRQGGYLRRFNPTLNTLLRVQDSLPTGVSMEELIQSDPNLTNYLILSSKLILSRRRQGRRELYSLALDREYFYLRKMTYTDEPSETEWEKVCLLPHQITNPGDEGGLDNGNFQRYYNFFDFLVVHENVEEQYTDTLFGRVETGSNGNRVEVLYVVLAFDRYLTLLRIEQYKNNSDSGNLNFNMSCVSQIRIESSFYNINVSCVVEVQQDHKNSVQLLVGTSKGILFLYEWELDEKRQYRYHLRWEKRALDAFTERYLQTYIQNGGDMRKEKEKGRKK
ncbi:hypothetical protein AGDE_12813 [Angomonas deanei]|uniref:Uncharacterized protein n=1 Tax=Angomonas deanei TaxID=59799 RepID=A0A7G2CG71_9TRYP|nr:hypothetical protein AGDE_12813 [Angomonas deanei]CAD2218888.1 hypothetical protein, conserved [Angomonas deanei]|eukprot:EPY23491.1 hypothetical protein AGDE_12813 [Angomonas deanei]